MNTIWHSDLVCNCHRISLIFKIRQSTSALLVSIIMINDYFSLYLCVLTTSEKILNPILIVLRRYIARYEETKYFAITAIQYIVTTIRSRLKENMNMCKTCQNASTVNKMITRYILNWILPIDINKYFFLNVEYVQTSFTMYIFNSS